MSGTPIRSNIEVDPNASSSPEESVKVPVEAKNATIWARFRVQLPEWKTHWSFYDKDHVLTGVMLIVATVLFTMSLSDSDHKTAYICTAIVLCFLAYVWFWLRVPYGPPFLGTKQGYRRLPAYRMPKLPVPITESVDKDYGLPISLASSTSAE